MAADLNDEQYGLRYDAAFLAALTTVPSVLDTASPIPVLSPADLASLHLQHLLAHAPDSVLFPFLHGVEGSNSAQNMFFSSASDDVPQYRGMMCVVCDEHEVEDSDESSADELDDSSDMDVDDDIDVDLDLELSREDDSVAVHSGDADDVVHIIDGKDGKEQHMHPVVMKPPPPLLPAHYPTRTPSKPPVALTSTFKPSDLIYDAGDGDWQFVPLRVPDGISLRNFGIQVPILATLSDIVIYSATSTGAKDSHSARQLAERFRMAISKKRSEREARLKEGRQLIDYNVFLLNATDDELRHPDSSLRHLVKRTHPSSSECTRSSSSSSDSSLKCNSINFALREKDEMRELTAASELLRVEQGIPEDSLDEHLPFGQIFLGNSNDVPIPSGGDGPDFDYDCGTIATNPAGYDICIECHDMAPFPSPHHLRAAEEKLVSLEGRWKENTQVAGAPRPPVHANSVIHLPFPSSPPSTAPMKSLVRFLEKWLTPFKDEPSTEKRKDEGQSQGRRWSLLSNAPNFPLFHMSSSSTPTVPSSRIRSFTSPPPANAIPEPPAPHRPSRPVKVLIYSSDGYTESSVIALCLLMSLKNLSLPEAYLELQVTKERSFFVYGADLGILRRWESEERRGAERGVRGTKYFGKMDVNVNPYAGWGENSSSVPRGISSPIARTGRARASTLPASSVFGWDHQTWFDDPRFDGSFPSRVLPFLYLGNLNHASNVYMLHALGITHVVSVGECALVPPQESAQPPATGLTTHYISSPTTVCRSRGSLWIEERAGRIKVLDIQGVCDDGIDTLEPQLEPICDWIDEARREGGKVLVHCRVGVSRSATVTIAYVMKHLNLSLVEAYLIVRSRRLSVLIQPNMRLLYNLCGWEVKLAKQRAATESIPLEEMERLGEELAGAVTWPFLAKEVHKLNEKYLH